MPTISVPVDEIVFVISEAFQATGRKVRIIQIGDDDLNLFEAVIEPVVPAWESVN